MLAQRVFQIFFVYYFAAAVVWLALGALPAIARAYPGLHERLHRWGFQARAEQIWAMGDDSYSTKELALEAGRRTSFVFHNEESGTRHNLSIYRDLAAAQPIYRGAAVDAPGQAVYSFTAPAAGSYYFRCDFHPEVTGTVTVYARGAAPGTGRWPLLAGLARGIAEASHEIVPWPQIVVQYAISALSRGLAVFLVWLRGEHRAARFLAIGLVGTAAVFNLQPHSNFEILPGMLTHVQELFLIDGLWHMPFHGLSGIFYIYAMLVFPDGKFVPRLGNRGGFRWPLQVVFLLGLAYLGFWSGLLSDGEPQGLVIFFGLIIPAAGIISQTIRFRRATRPAERQQSRVLLGALTLALAAGILYAGSNLLVDRLGARLPDARVADLKGIVFVVFPVLMAGIPLVLLVVLLR